MASVTRHAKSKFWYACFKSRDGRHLKRSTGTTNHDEALRIANELEQGNEAMPPSRGPAINQRAPSPKADNGLETGEPSIISVASYLEDWLTTIRTRNSAATYERYRNTVRLFKACLGTASQQPVNTVTPRQIEKFLTWRLESGVAAKTAIIDVKILKTAFSRAEAHDLIVKNPVRGLLLPKVTSSRREIFTHTEVQMLLDAAPNVEWQTVILLGYFLGARLTDCASMGWENVRPEAGVIVYEQKKTGKEVVVPMHYHLIEHLTHLAESGTEGYLCPNLAPRKPGGKSGLSEAFKRIMKRARIDTMTVPGKGIRKFSKRSFHSLRHSFNSALANAGVGQELRMKLTGHSSTAMNDQYTHLDVAALKKAVTALPLFDGEGGSG